MITDYDEPLFRPPSEAESLILQATIGCSYNKCTFCSMYKSKKYKIKSFDIITQEIDFLSAYSNVRRVFIADGDALALKTSLLLNIFNKLKKTFPKLRRISLYGNTLNIMEKTDLELEQLSKAGLSIIYLGFESGSDYILEKIHKGVTKQDQAEAVNRAQNASLNISATLITGLGGKEHWKEHIEQSAELVNMTSPKYLSTLTLMMEPGCREKFTTSFKRGFSSQEDRGILEEEKLLIGLINSPKRIIFRSNHASNVLPLSGNLPLDKGKLINQIDMAIGDGTGIRHFGARGL